MRLREGGESGLWNQDNIRIDALRAARFAGWADARLPEMLAMLEEVVLINSHTLNKPGVDEVGGVFRAFLESLGMRIKILAQKNHGDLVLASSKAAGPSGNLLLMGHMDTVFPKGNGFDWFKKDETKSYGPGVADMKGGLVAACFGLKALAEEGLLDRIPLLFLLNSDEEMGSPVSGGVIKDLAAKSLAGLVFECGGAKGQVVTGRKGKLGFKLMVKGRAGHAAAPGVAKASALVELSRKVLALEELNGLVPGLLVNVGQAAGGIGANTVAEDAWALVDVRLPDTEAERLFLKQAEEIASRCQTVGVRSELIPTSGRPPMPETKAGRALAGLAKRLAKVMGFEAEPEQRAGVSDANYIAFKGAPVLDGLGPVGSGDHSSREYIITSTLPQRAALAAGLAVELHQASSTDA